MRRPMRRAPSVQDAPRVVVGCGMSDPDPRLARWALEHRAERQSISSAELFATGVSDDGRQPGWGGILIRSSDNMIGARELELQLRPVLLGEVEVRVELTTAGPDARRAHVKRAYLYAPPSALRELAKQLLETAEAADKLKLKPRPVP
jgi:hypothetical protein